MSYADENLFHAGHYFRMPTLAFKLPPHAFKVYGYLLNRLGKKDYTWAKLETIAADCYLDRKTASTALRLLEARGYIKRQRRFARSTITKIMPIVVKEQVSFGGPDGTKSQTPFRGADGTTVNPQNGTKSDCSDGTTVNPQNGTTEPESKEPESTENQSQLASPAEPSSRQARLRLEKQIPSDPFTDFLQS